MPCSMLMQLLGDSGQLLTCDTSTMHSSLSLKKLAQWLSYVLILNSTMMIYLAAGSPAALEQRKPNGRWAPIEPLYKVAKGDSRGSCERHRKILVDTYQEAAFMVSNSLKALQDVENGWGVTRPKSPYYRKSKMLLAIFGIDGPHHQHYLDRVKRTWHIVTINAYTAS